MDAFKVADASSYDPVAESFAHFTDIITRPLAATTVRLGQLHAEDRVLDVGTGSGIVALAAAVRLGDRGSVTGIDLSDGLLQTARKKVLEAGLYDRIVFEKGDAEALPFGDSTFDRVLSLFALLHFPHPGKAVGEMLRVLKPGGRLVIGIGSGPSWNSISGWRHRLGLLPDVARVQSGTLLIAPTYLDRLVARHIPESPHPEETDLARDRSFRAANTLRLLQRSGLGSIGTHWEGHQLVLNTPEEFWRMQSTFSSFARKRLQTATPQQIATLRQDFDNQCERVLARGGKLVYRYAAFFVYGQRP